MTVPTPEVDVELANAIYRTGNASAAMLKLVPKAAQTALLVTPTNYDATVTFPSGYTSLGGIGHAGVAFALKTTSGTTADADFTGATPAIAVPPVGTAVYNTNTHKLQIRDASASWLISAAFS